MTVLIKRAYEEFSPADGKRVLVDRLWPRGIKKENAHIDEWLKELAPSTELRKWFNHEVEKWPEFQQKYRAEVAGNAEFEQLRQWSQAGTVTLIFAAKDAQHNNAVVLQQLLA